MGHYVSVRGWIEIDPEKLPYVRHLLQEFPNASGENVLTPEQVRLYAQGWVLAEDSPNWTKYCFYGADIRREALAWLLAQVRMLAQTLHEGDEIGGDTAQRYDGMFCIDDDEGELSLVWYLKNGAVKEAAHSHPALDAVAQEVHGRVAS
ncbi:MAG: hypothetical protein FJZ47_13415 [Candidatus Tectomicrobia bacterium]|uniref:Uncharacterized protein n=1 Tax=Tectimicrobiota bacterium TaxID=2528274 RepID=A0A938B1C5_UNCTE|nr:hypothetical protein [Candidatus Tectomicrobia bacterium]